MIILKKFFNESKIFYTEFTKKNIIFLKLFKFIKNGTYNWISTTQVNFQNILINFFFFKRKNFNKLYFSNKYILLSPGIVLKYNNLLKKSLKNKTSSWNLFFAIILKFQKMFLIFHTQNFFSNLIKILKNLKKFNLTSTWLFINLFKKKFFFKCNKIKRIKKWIKKKYFRVLI